MEQPANNPQPIFIVVMGVSGTGKSTLGSALALALDMPYVEGDDLHPQTNVDKMANGQPLTDTDREPWLALIRRTALEVVGGQAKRRGVVISCSALKVYYREVLRGDLAVSVSKEASGSRDSEKTGVVSPDGNPDLDGVLNPHLRTYFVFIDGPRDVLMERMEKRPGHFMKASMLDSQLATLESPVGEKGVVVVSILDSTEDQVRMALEGLKVETMR